MQLHWSGATRYHDWYTKPRTIAKRMLSQAQHAGLIGLVDWVSLGHDDERKEVTYSEGVLEGVLERMLDRGFKRGVSNLLTAGGTKPFAWNMNLLLFPFRKDRGKVQGYNILKLWFDTKAFSGPNASDMLMQTFSTIHTPDNTEFAFIHPYKRWSELTTLGEPYEEPVTLGPMFSGVYWAIFLGRGHLAFFDLDKLRNLQAYQVKWLGDDGLFVRVSRDIADATSPAVEEEMFRLTEIFRNARR